MNCKVVLHSTLREILPSDNKGCIVLDLPEESTASDVIKILNIVGPFICAINDELDRSLGRRIQEGDELHFFRPSSGGC